MTAKRTKSDPKEGFIQMKNNPDTYSCSCMLCGHEITRRTKREINIVGSWLKKKERIYIRNLPGRLTAREKNAARSAIAAMLAGEAHEGNWPKNVSAKDLEGALAKL